ncbi:hypothetical protein DC28_03570 [Spirochaeta lutea]|uniref:Uncharacterized protein n=1 Tax=Spirochaeta lutea TaxID=1480694 RepID=A0A098R007_9SPIO|nr:hypothetical protein DC28_03570 [Spirochaeta lutea]
MPGQTKKPRAPRPCLLLSLRPSGERAGQHTCIRTKGLGLSPVSARIVPSGVHWNSTSFRGSTLFPAGFVSNAGTPPRTVRSGSISGRQGNGSAPITGSTGGRYWGSGLSGHWNHPKNPKPVHNRSS